MPQKRYIGPQRKPVLVVRFFRTQSGREPAREWVRSLCRDDRRAVGEMIGFVEFGWPVGFPMVRKIERDLWELRIDLMDGIGRVLFTISGNTAVLLHGFSKKTQQTPLRELETARRRKRHFAEISQRGQHDA